MTLTILLGAKWLGLDVRYWTYIAIGCAVLAAVIVLLSVFSGIGLNKAKVRNRVAKSNAERRRQEKEERERQERQARAEQEERERQERLEREKREWEERLERERREREERLAEERKRDEERRLAEEARREEERKRDDERRREDRLMMLEMLKQSSQGGRVRPEGQQYETLYATAEVRTEDIVRSIMADMLPLFREALAGLPPVQSASEPRQNGQAHSAAYGDTRLREAPPAESAARADDFSAFMPENEAASADAPVIPAGTDIRFLTEGLTLDAAYEGLSKTQKSFYNRLRQYAAGKPEVSAVKTSKCENFRCGKRSVVKLQIKRNTTVAIFALENERLRRYRRENAEEEPVAIKVRPTEVLVTNEAALETAKDMVDLALEQIFAEREERKRLRREARRKKAKKESDDENLF